MLITITPGLTIDATIGSAYFLGFASGMQYNGLDRASVSGLAGNSTPLTNCFASCYGMITTFDNAAFNLKTMFAKAGSFKGFDVLVIDPTHIFMDVAVNYEMCEYGAII